MKRFVLADGAVLLAPPVYVSRVCYRGVWMDCLDNPSWSVYNDCRIAPAPPRSLFLIEDQFGTRHSNGHDSQATCDRLVAAWNAKEEGGRVFRTVEYVEKLVDN